MKHLNVFNIPRFEQIADVQRNVSLYATMFGTNYAKASHCILTFQQTELE